MLTATVWFDKQEKLWHIKVSDGYEYTEPATTSRLAILKDLINYGVRAGNVTFV